MKRIIIIIFCCLIPSLLFAKYFSGEYSSEWQWNLKQKTNWANLLRLNLNIPIKKTNGSFDAATIHTTKTNESIIDDWQTFSNIETENKFAAIAVLGYRQTWKYGNLFIGVRNIAEDFFTSNVTSLFTNSSCGVFPTISASYPIPNYPFSGLTIYCDATKDNLTFRNSLYNGMGYNGWNRHDNPFIIRPTNDGIFNISQLEYSYKDGQYFAGVAIHTHQFPIDNDGVMAPPDESCKKFTYAWWIYGEQAVWKSGDKSISCMMQYSENSSHANACYRYGEIGCAYCDNKNACGLSAQYAHFKQGAEYSLEITWKRQLSETIALQPSFQHIKNDTGTFNVLCTRLYCYF